MNSIDTTGSFRQVDNLNVTEADDGLIVFNPATDRVHHLNTTAGVLFSLCERPRTWPDLLHDFRELFDVGESEQTAVRDALDELLRQGVLQQGEAP